MSKDKIAELEDSVTAFSEFVEAGDVLQADILRSIDEWNKNPTDGFWGRTTIRCLFARIEGSLWHMRRIALRQVKLRGITLTEKESLVLAEKKKDEDGKLINGFLPFPKALRKTFTLFAKAHGLAYQFPESGFEKLCKLAEKRGDLMHPKLLSSIVTDQEDWELTKLAVRWFVPSIGTLLNGTCQCPITSTMLAQFLEIPPEKLLEQGLK